jgi:hypothetical protein
MPALEGGHVPGGPAFPEMSGDPTVAGAEPTSIVLLGGGILVAVRRSVHR